jgi:hypothetical protein
LKIINVKLRILNLQKSKENSMMSLNKKFRFKPKFHNSKRTFLTSKMMTIWLEEI